MPRNNKGVHRARNPNDLARNPKSVKLRDTQKGRLDQSKHRRNFSALVSNLLDEHFKQEDFIAAAPNMRLTHDDVACIVGRGVDKDGVIDCLLAWIENEPLPPVSISKKSLELYNMFYDMSEADEAFDKFLEHCYRIVEYIAHFYFRGRVAFLTASGLSYIVQNSNKIDADSKKWAAKSINCAPNIALENIEILSHLSPELRFATYTCWRYKILRRKVTVPEDVRLAEEHLFQGSSRD